MWELVWPRKLIKFNNEKKKRILVRNRWTLKMLNEIYALLRMSVIVNSQVTYMVGTVKDQ